MSYVTPKEVIHPKSSRFSVEVVEEVIYDGGEGNIVLAKVKLVGHDSLEYAMRWNGTSDYEMGFPSSRRKPLWFAVPKVWGNFLELAMKLKFDV